MNDEQFIKVAATNVANFLRMPLGEIDPLRLLRMYSPLFHLLGGDRELMVHFLNTHNKHLDFCPAAFLTSEHHMKKITVYLESHAYR
jgi:hypothetical protein